MADISQNLLNKFNVLVPFTKNYTQKIHASKIAQILQLPQRTVARKLEFLEKKKLLFYCREGKNKYYFLDFNRNYSFSLLQIIESYKEMVFHLEYPSISLLLDELSKNHGLILFGSYAKKKAKETSDVDLVIFSRKNKNIEKIIGRYPFEVNIHYVTFNLFEKRLKTNWPLAKEIAENHIFFGPKEKIIKILIDSHRK